MIECNRTPEQARRDVAAGRLTAATLLRAPMLRAAWTIRLTGSKAGSGMLLSVQTLEPQVYGKLDEAVEALEQMGFTVDQLKLM
jgi:hypothetical protein